MFRLDAIKEACEVSSVATGGTCVRCWGIDAPSSVWRFFLNFDCLD